MYSRGRSSLGLVKLRSLGDDTVVLGGLHARLCHAFLVVNNNIQFEKKLYLPISSKKHLLKKL